MFLQLSKNGATDDSGEKLDGHISDEDYLMCKKIWNEFNMKKHDYYLKKKMFCY